MQAVVAAQAGEECGGEVEDGQVVGGESCVDGLEPEAGRSGDSPVEISLWTAAKNWRAGLDGAGTEFGPGKIDLDPAMAAGFLAGALEIANHAEPDARGVMGAVNAHAIHAVAEEVEDEVEVGGGVGGHGDHDGDAAMGVGLTEERAGVFGQEACAFADADWRLEGGKQVGAGDGRA